MIEQDTIRLLRECDSGIQMGISAIDDVLDRVNDDTFRGMLRECMAKHEKLKNEIVQELNRFKHEGKEPPAAAKAMSKMKTGIKMAIHDDDATIAELITDGCNMGIKSLSRYLNKYEAASETSKDIAKRLIALEEELSCEIRKYL